jgi:hypothetical protein
MLAMRRYAVRHPRLFGGAYRALEAMLQAVGPLARGIGRERLEPLARVDAQ